MKRKILFALIVLFTLFFAKSSFALIQCVLQNSNPWIVNIDEHFDVIVSVSIEDEPNISGHFAVYVRPNYGGMFTVNEFVQFNGDGWYDYSPISVHGPNQPGDYTLDIQCLLELDDNRILEGHLFPDITAIDPDPCQNVICPQAECQNNILVTNQYCEESQCVGGDRTNCDNLDKVNNTIRYCQANNLREYQEYYNYSCSNNACQYQTERQNDRLIETCQFGCNNNVCLPDPCANVNCQNPICQNNILLTNRRCENRQCVGGNQTNCDNLDHLNDQENYCKNINEIWEVWQRQYFDDGYCSVNQCQTRRVLQSDNGVSTCLFGCNNGACLPDPCANVNCQNPICQNNILLTNRRCENGQCVVGLQVPCDNLDSTSNFIYYCDNNQQRRFKIFTNFSCVIFQCQAEETHINDELVRNCQFSCEQGECQPDPCLNVNCPNRCQNNILLTNQHCSNRNCIGGNQTNCDTLDRLGEIKRYCEGNDLKEYQEYFNFSCSNNECQSQTERSNVRLIEACEENRNEDEWICRGNDRVHIQNIFLGGCQNNQCRSEQTTRDLEIIHCPGICENGFCRINPCATQRCHQGNIWCFDNENHPNQITIACNCGCANAICNQCCQNECEPNQTECFGLGYHACQRQNNGCYQWNEVQLCRQDYSCFNGSCVRNPRPCVIESARWSTTNAIDGTTVQIIFETTGICQGQEIDIKIYEDDGTLFRDDFQIGFCVIANNERNILDWQVAYIDDQWQNPEYYFEISYNNTTTTSENLLTIYPQEIRIDLLNNILASNPPEDLNCDNFFDGLSIDCIKLADSAHEEPSLVEKVFDAAEIAVGVSWIGGCAACIGTFMVQLATGNVMLATRVVGCSACLGELDTSLSTIAGLFRTYKLTELFGALIRGTSRGQEIITDSFASLIPESENAAGNIIWDSLVTKQSLQIWRYKYQNPIWAYPPGGESFIRFNAQENIFVDFANLARSNKKFIASLFEGNENLPKIYNVAEAARLNKIRKPTVRFEDFNPDAQDDTVAFFAPIINEIVIYLDRLRPIPLENIRLTKKNQALIVWLHEICHAELPQVFRSKNIQIYGTAAIRHPVTEYINEYRIIRYPESTIDTDILAEIKYILVLEQENQNRFNSQAFNYWLRLYYGNSIERYHLHEFYKMAELTNDIATMEIIRDSFIQNEGRNAWLEFFDETILMEQAAIAAITESTAGAIPSQNLLDAIDRFMLNYFPNLGYIHKIDFPNEDALAHKQCIENSVWWVDNNNEQIEIEKDCSQNEICLEAHCVQNENPSADFLLLDGIGFIHDKCRVRVDGLAAIQNNARLISCQIEWGDGNSDECVINDLENNYYELFGLHNYNGPGPFTLKFNVKYQESPDQPEKEIQEELEIKIANCSASNAGETDLNNKEDAESKNPQEIAESENSACACSIDSQKKSINYLFLLIPLFLLKRKSK